MINKIKKENIKTDSDKLKNIGTDFVFNLIHLNIENYENIFIFNSNNMLNFGM